MATYGDAKNNFYPPAPPVMSLENLHPQKSKGFVPACTARFSLDVLPGSPRHRGAAPLAPPFADSWIFHGSTRFSERLIYVVVKRVRLGSYSILRTEIQLLQRSRHAIGTICASSVFHIKFLNRDPVFQRRFQAFDLVIQDTEYLRVGIVRIAPIILSWFYRRCQGGRKVSGSEEVSSWLVYSLGV